MRSCNCTIKLIFSAIWCIGGVMLFLLVVIQAIAGHIEFGQAVKSGATGLVFAALGGYLAAYYWSRR